MNSFKTSFTNKRFRYGTFSTVMIIAAIALFILINLVADQLNVSYDLTRERMFTLSSGSIEIIQNLDTDVYIYSLWPTGRESFAMQQLLEEYSSHSNRITLQNRDPILHPHFVEQFAQPDEAIADGSIIVVGPDRYRVVHAGELIAMDFDPRTGQAFARGINLEPLVTNAINFVTATTTPVIYHVVGNNEFDLPTSLVDEFRMAGYEIREANLLTQEIPEEADILLITMPGRDWSAEQAERVRVHLENDGRAIVFGGFRGARFPNFDSVLASFGVRVGNYLVVEANPNYFLMNLPVMLLPNFVSHETTDSLMLRNFMPLFIEATGVDVLELRRATTNIQTLITTSSQAFGRYDPAIQGITQTDGDIPGPLSLAVAIEENFMLGTQTATTRMIVVGCDSILLEALNQEIAGTNYDFIINSLDWLSGEEARVWIPGRALPFMMPLRLTQLDALMMAAIAVIVLPLVFGVTGLVVWLRRRNA